MRFDQLKGEREKKRKERIMLTLKRKENERVSVFEDETIHLCIRRQRLVKL
jgi:hypothetical protein